MIKETETVAEEQSGAKARSVLRVRKRRNLRRIRVGKKHQRALSYSRHRQVADIVVRGLREGEASATVVTSHRNAVPAGRRYPSGCKQCLLRWHGRAGPRSLRLVKSETIWPRSGRLEVPGAKRSKATASDNATGD